MFISVCDPHSADVKQLIGLLATCMKKYLLDDSLLDIDIFSTTDELLASQKDYTLIFLGILFNGTSGLEAARQLKSRRKQPVIIFTTTSPDHCL